MNRDKFAEWFDGSDFAKGVDLTDPAIARAVFENVWTVALSALDAQGGEAVAWFQREPGVDRRDLIAMVAKEFEGAPGTFPLFARSETPQKPKYWRWYCEVKEEYLISTEKPVYTHYKNLEALYAAPPPPEAMLKELEEFRRVYPTLEDSELRQAIDALLANSPER